jgi:16S rRNA (adenine1518-N6/adenine1519-N6)-dimethyltransferase
MRPRKRFGQHFLTDPDIIHGILNAIAPAANEHLVEIGPGRGALTRGLAGSNGQLTLVEIDRDLAAELEASCPDARVICADALRFDFSALDGQTGLRIVGNLPYNISTPLLFHLYAHLQCIQDMTFMLQEEVVDRICAGPGSADYGRLSIMSQYHCVGQKLFTVPPTAFSPPPKVMSAVISLSPSNKLPRAADVHCLEEVVLSAFSARRKTVRNALGKLLTDAEICAIDIDPGVRPAELSPGDYIRCADALWGKRRP